MKFSRILFPVDLSETSEKMVPYAFELADAFNASLHLLFVVRELNHYSTMNVPPAHIEQFRKRVTEGAEKSMDEFLNRHFPSNDNVRTDVSCGDIAEQILAWIEKESIDLLLLGTHGRKGLERIFFGSIADRVVKTSPVPVFMVNPYKRNSMLSAGSHKKRKILFPVDLSDISPKLAPYVELAAEAFHADIELLSVIRPSGYFAALYEPDHDLETFKSAVQKKTKASLSEFKDTHFEKFPGTNVRTAYGLIPEEILHRIDAAKIDLLVMGTHGRRGLDKVVFGSVAEQVSKSSPVPLLLINPYRIRC